MSVKKETKISLIIVEWLNLNGFRAWKTHGNRNEVKGRPDIIGWEVGTAVHLAIEVKTPEKSMKSNKALSVEQQDHLQVAYRDGCIASCCTSLETVFLTIECPRCKVKTFGDHCFFCNKSKYKGV